MFSTLGDEERRTKKRNWWDNELKLKFEENNTQDELIDVFLNSPKS